VGARALVAVERDADGYDLHRSQWGGECVDRLVDLVRVDEVPPDLVDPEPFRAGVSADELLGSLDPREYEALVVADGRTEAYLVCRLGIETGREAGDGPARTQASTSPAVGAHAGVEAAALVPWPGEAVADRLRRFVRTVKGVLGDAVDAGLLSDPAATRYLAVRLARHPETPDCDGIIWIDGGDSRP